jgi:hypothetical protein
MTPGMHIVLAEAQSRLGKLDAAELTNQRSFKYEAQWDEKKNYQNNKEYYWGLEVDLRAAREPRRRYESFEAVWGEALRLVKEQKDHDNLSWK